MKNNNSQPPSPFHNTFYKKFSEKFRLKLAMLFKQIYPENFQSIQAALTQPQQQLLHEPNQEEQDKADALFFTQTYQEWLLATDAHDVLSVGPQLNKELLKNFFLIWLEKYNNHPLVEIKILSSAQIAAVDFIEHLCRKWVEKAITEQSLSPLPLVYSNSEEEYFKFMFRAKLERYLGIDTRQTFLSQEEMKVAYLLFKQQIEKSLALPVQKDDAKTEDLTADLNSNLSSESQAVGVFTNEPALEEISLIEEATPTEEQETMDLNIPIDESGKIKSVLTKILLVDIFDYWYNQECDQLLAQNSRQNENNPQLVFTLKFGHCFTMAEQQALKKKYLELRALLKPMMNQARRQEGRCYLTLACTAMTMEQLNYLWGDIKLKLEKVTAATSKIEFQVIKLQEQVKALRKTAENDVLSFAVHNESTPLQAHLSHKIAALENKIEDLEFKINQHKTEIANLTALRIMVDAKGNEFKEILKKQLQKISDPYGNKNADAKLGSQAANLESGRTRADYSIYGLPTFEGTTRESMLDKLVIATGKNWGYGSLFAYYTLTKFVKTDATTPAARQCLLYFLMRIAQQPVQFTPGLSLLESLNHELMPELRDVFLTYYADFISMDGKQIALTTALSSLSAILYTVNAKPGAILLEGFFTGDPLSLPEITTFWDWSLVAALASGAFVANLLVNLVPYLLLLMSKLSPRTMWMMLIGGAITMLPLTIPALGYGLIPNILALVGYVFGIPLMGLGVKKFAELISAWSKGPTEPASLEKQELIAALKQALVHILNEPQAQERLTDMFVELVQLRTQATSSDEFMKGLLALMLKQGLAAKFTGHLHRQEKLAAFSVFRRGLSAIGQGLLSKLIIPTLKALSSVGPVGEMAFAWTAAQAIYLFMQNNLVALGSTNETLNLSLSVVTALLCSTTAMVPTILLNIAGVLNCRKLLQNFISGTEPRALAGILTPRLYTLTLIVLYTAAIFSPATILVATRSLMQVLLFLLNYFTGLELSAGQQTPVFVVAYGIALVATFCNNAFMPLQDVVAFVFRLWSKFFDPKLLQIDEMVGAFAQAILVIQNSSNAQAQELVAEFRAQFLKNLSIENSPTLQAPIQEDLIEAIRAYGQGQQMNEEETSLVQNFAKQHPYLTMKGLATVSPAQPVERSCGTPIYTGLFARSRFLAETLQEVLSGGQQRLMPQASTHSFT